MIHGSRLSLLSGVISIVLAIGIGVLLGNRGRILRRLARRVVDAQIDVALAFPSILIRAVGRDGLPARLEPP
ncbi:MAG: hypothetical protein R3C99_23100 [Pirellulaceae bacterium]